MGRIQRVVLIMPVITTTLKSLDAVGEARMVQSAQKDASPGVETLLAAAPQPVSDLLRTPICRRKPYDELSIIHNQDGAITSPIGPATHSAAPDGGRPSRNSRTRPHLRLHLAARPHHCFRDPRPARDPAGNCLRLRPEPRNSGISTENLRAAPVRIRC